MGTRFLGIGREKARSRSRQNNYAKKQESAYNAFEDILGGLSQEADAAGQRATLTADDLYGEEMTRATDSIRSNANNTKMTLGRAAAAKGGDVTGARSVVFDGIDENVNEAEGNVIRSYSGKADAANERERRRRDQLMQLIMSGEFKKLDFANSNLQGEISRDLQRRQANKQLGVDILGTLLNAGTSILTGGAK